MGSEIAPLNLAENVEAIVNHYVGQTFNTLSRDVFEKALKRLDQVHESHPIKTAQMPVCHGLIAIFLGDNPDDVVKRSKNLPDSPPIMKDRRLCFVREGLDTLQ